MWTVTIKTAHGTIVKKVNRFYNNAIHDRDHAIATLADIVSVTITADFADNAICDRWSK